MPTATKKKTSAQTTRKGSNKGTASGASTKGKPAKKAAGGSAKSGVAGTASSNASSRTAARKTVNKAAGSDAKKGTVKAGQTTNKKKPTAAKGVSKASGVTTKSPKSAKSSGTKEKGIVGRVTEAVGELFSGRERDAIDLLKEDHQRVDAYFKEVKAAEDANHEKVFKKIKAELDLHAHVEEVIFYPHLMKAGTEELKKIVREGVEEHAQVKTLLSELSELKGTDKVFKAKLKVLIENVEHHVEEEEDEMFPLVQDELDEATLVNLAGRIEKEKAKSGVAKPKSRAAKAGKKS